MTTTSRELWGTVQNKHRAAFDEQKKRTPITILANVRTLNMLVMGRDTDGFLQFDKATFRTSLGDIYFQRHFGMEDGEVFVL